jgi:uncharacterized protein
MELTIELIREKGWLIFETITGSRAYGLDGPASDTDIRGVYIVPEEIFYSLDYPEQVSNEKNDIVFYELRRFIELLAKNNPNVMELLGENDSCVMYRHKVMNEVTPALFLSKLCEQTFANYAYSQIKKAYGLEKKIVNPVDKKRKSVLDFCFVYQGKEAINAATFFHSRGMDETRAGLTSVTHLRDCYNLFYSDQHVYGGIVRKETSNDVMLSSIPKGEEPVSLLYFNRDAYSVYCKNYREYWEWVEKRNEDRYRTTMSHGKNYDSKNMMHVFRLLLMAKEIAVESKINVFRKDREFLLDVKQGKFGYDELLNKATGLKDSLPELFRYSDLPPEPDREVINQVLVKMRKLFYLENTKKIIGDKDN